MTTADGLLLLLGEMRRQHEQQVDALRQQYAQHLSALESAIRDLPDIDYEPATMPLETGTEPVFMGRVTCTGCGTDVGSRTNLGLLCPGCFNSTPNVA